MIGEELLKRLSVKIATAVAMIREEPLKAVVGENRNSNGNNWRRAVAGGHRRKSEWQMVGE